MSSDDSDVKKMFVTHHKPLYIKYLTHKVTFSFKITIFHPGGFL